MCVIGFIEPQSCNSSQHSTSRIQGACNIYNNIGKCIHVLVKWKTLKCKPLARTMVASRYAPVHKYNACACKIFIHAKNVRGDSAWINSVGVSCYTHRLAASAGRILGDAGINTLPLSIFWCPHDLRNGHKLVQVSQWHIVAFTLFFITFEPSCYMKSLV